jgi:beta-lactamase class A
MFIDPVIESIGTRMITRRKLAVGASAFMAGCAAARASDGRSASAWTTALERELTRIEQESGGRLGVAVLDTETGSRAHHRHDERFPMCSTFKVLAAAAVLAQVDKGETTLARRVRFEPHDVVVYSPVTKDRTGGEGMTLDELCEAAMTVSDNTAGNLLLSTIGGPAGLTRYARTLGDRATRLDRIEPDLNEALPGDPRDTTIPAAMVENLRELVLAEALSASSRDKLVGWLLGNKTGDTRLRAGLPKDWRVGDKTGSGERGTTNDVGVIWPPQRKPLIVSIYLTETAAAPAQRNATLAAVGQAIAKTAA